MDTFVAKFSASGSLLWSTYLGGNGIDRGEEIAVASDGSCYVTGLTGSSNFPILSAYNSTYGGEYDAFVTKFSSSGSLLWSTYLGGNEFDVGNSIAVTSDGVCYVTGATESSNFPTLNAYNSTYGGAEDVFVTKFSSSGSLLWSTFIGRDDWDQGNDIALASDGSCYIAGQTKSENFPTMYAFNSTFGGWHDAFVLKLSVSGDLQWSTFMGGHGFDGVYGIAVSSDESCYLTGYTESANFPTLNAYNATTDNIFDDPGDAFVSKFSESGLLLWSTYLGGNEDDAGLGIAVDLDGNCYVVGDTGSTNFPTLNAFDDTITLYNYDAFLSKFSTSGSLLWSTYLGGTDDEEGLGIAVDNEGNCYAIGYTQSNDFPLKNPYDSTYNNYEAFITKIGTITDTNPFSANSIIGIIIGIPMLALVLRKRRKK
ncbi:MAG: SBBP repeat-containing protein [Candidatus Heimdallarchaeota archaeon]